MRSSLVAYLLFVFFNVADSSVCYSLSLHDALPISRGRGQGVGAEVQHLAPPALQGAADGVARLAPAVVRRARAPALDGRPRDRTSTRLNSSHSQTSYAVFCLKKTNSMISSNHQHST